MLQQIIKFELEMFDVRTKQSIKIVDDRNFVKSIQIRKDLQLNNQAVIVFNKSKAYVRSGIEYNIKLYNYVKLKLTTLNYGNTNLIKTKDSDPKDRHDFFFSGFITDVGKLFNLSETPESSVSVTVSDFAYLFKTAFYTKNLVFLDILNQTVPEFRLLNFNDIFNDPNGKLLDQPYTPNEMGFLFFCFVYYKFLYPMTHDISGAPKSHSSSSSDSESKIYKNFKVFMPFDFNNPKVKSMFSTQAQTLILYKQFQGTVFELFKYLYPEPIFEFNTYETESSNILIIRPTPFMAFSRKFGTETTNLSFVREGGGGLDSVEQSVQMESSDFSVDSYDIIESDENGGDFGFKQVKEITGSTDINASSASVSSYIADKVSKISDNIQSTINKPFSVYDFLPDYAESLEIQNLFFDIQLFNNNFIETLTSQRSSNSVVNIIWTTPVTDTAVLNLSGRAIVFAKMKEDLATLQTGMFDEYIYNQFAPKNDSNPVFLWNYKNQNPNGFVSGDINYFGIREFEIKWNFMTFYENALGVVLRSMNKSALEKIKESCKDKPFIDDIVSHIQGNSDTIDKKGFVPVKTGVKSFLNSIKSPAYDWSKNDSKNISYKDIRASYVKPRRDNSSIFLKEALKDPILHATLQQFGLTVSEIQDFTSYDKLIDLLSKAKEKSVNQFGVFAKRINGVVSKAFRENEHLYEMGISTIINTSIFPGIILESFNEASEYNRPWFKGYVTSVNHTLDFNKASLKSLITLSRTASDDSGVGA